MGSGPLTGGFDGWRGASPGGAGGGGGVQETLAAIFAFGQADNPTVDNVLGMPTGNMRWADHVANNVLPGQGFFETFDVDDDARTGVWFARRYYDNGIARNSGTFVEEQLMNPSYAGEPNIPDGVNWIDAIGEFTSSAVQTGVVGLADLMWQRKYVANNFFNNLPKSIPDLGATSAQQVALEEQLYRHGPVSTTIQTVRRLNGWGQQSNYVEAQAAGIEPGFLAVYTSFNLGDAPGNGSGFFISAGSPDVDTSGGLRAGLDGHMLGAGAGTNWAARIWGYLSGTITAIGQFDGITGVNSLIGLVTFGADGSGAATSAAGTAAFRYNAGTNKIQYSKNTGAWTDLV